MVAATAIVKVKHLCHPFSLCMVENVLLRAATQTRKARFPTGRIFFRPHSSDRRPSQARRTRRRPSLGWPPCAGGRRARRTVAKASPTAVPPKRHKPFLARLWSGRLARNETPVHLQGARGERRVLQNRLQADKPARTNASFVSRGFWILPLFNNNNKTVRFRERV